MLRLTEFYHARTRFVWAISGLLVGLYLSQGQPGRANPTLSDSAITVHFISCVSTDPDFSPTIEVFDRTHEQATFSLTRISKESRIYEATLHEPPGYYILDVGGRLCRGAATVVVLGAPYDRSVTIIGEPVVTRLRDAVNVIAGRIPFEISRVRATCIDVWGKPSSYEAVIQHGAYYIENIWVTKCQLKVDADDRILSVTLKGDVVFGGPKRSATVYAIRDISQHDLEESILDQP